MVAGVVKVLSTNGKSKSSYLAIRLSSLRVDSVTNFDLYLKSRKQAPPILYRERNLSFDEATRERLREHRVEELYIPLDQEQDYHRYVEENLSTVLSDDSIQPEEKSHLLYDSAQHALHEILLNPSSPDVLPRSANLAESIVGYMYGDRDAFLQFLRVASFDYSTFTHSVNVFVYCITLAERLGYTDKQFLNDFGQGALLHDIGKSKVGEEILHHKGALSEEQWQIMRQHPSWGHEMLLAQGVTNNIVLEVTRSHHEKLTGAGYPDGLSRDEIPRHVRISTICDIFDALTTRRAYKTALGSFPSLRTMQEEMSGELDQDIFRVFVEMMSDSAQEVLGAK